MMMKTILLCVLLFNTALLFGADDKDWTFDPKTSTLIPNYLGKIKALKGKAIIGDRELKKGSKVYNNDLIQTSEASFIVMEMIDLTTVTLGPNSDFKVENWKYRTKTDREAQFSIIKGKLRALVRSKAQSPDQLKIKTPTVSMGIRGTEFMVNVVNVGGKAIEQVALLEGSIHMEGPAPELNRDLIPGDHAVIVKNDEGDGISSHEERKFTPEEAKSYQEFEEPEIPRLLKTVTIASNEKTSTTMNEVEKKDSPSANVSLKKRKDKPRSLQQNLEQLNTTREENRKTK
jgi:hypothetical protein